MWGLQKLDIILEKKVSPNLKLVIKVVHLTKINKILFLTYKVDFSN